jgi:hypothetical protein
VNLSILIKRPPISITTQNEEFSASFKRIFARERKYLTIAGYICSMQSIGPRRAAFALRRQRDRDERGNAQQCR